MNKIHFSAPGQYLIRAHGSLVPEWFDRFGALQVISPPPEADRAITILQGSVNDQVELAGILNTLYELHLSLLLVQYIDRGKGRVLDSTRLVLGWFLPDRTGSLGLWSLRHALSTPNCTFQR